jgi:drug/metabolite transporter (DMT)-like permease
MSGMVLWGELSALAGAFQWAFCGVWLTRLSQKMHVLTIAMWRAVISLVFFIALVPFTGGLEMFAALPARTLIMLALSVLIAQGVGDITFFMAARRIGMLRTMPIAEANPLITAGLAAIFLGERITLQVLGGAVLILIGAYLLSSGARAAQTPHAGKIDLLGLGLAALTAVCWASGYVLLTPVAQAMHPVAVSVFRQAIIGVWFLVIMPRPLGFRQTRALSRGEAAMLVLISIISSGLGSFLYVWSMRWAGATLAAVLGATAPVFSTPLSIIFLKEKLTRRIIIGTALIIGGVWLVLLG